MNEDGGYRTYPELLLDRAMDRMLHRSVAADGLMCEEHEYVGAFDRPTIDPGLGEANNDDERSFEKGTVVLILDDHSRLCCHLQWYLSEIAEALVHGLSQAIQKCGLPRALLTDNGPATVHATEESKLVAAFYGRTFHFLVIADSLNVCGRLRGLRGVVKIARQRYGILFATDRKSPSQPI